MVIRRVSGIGVRLGGMGLGRVRIEDGGRWEEM
jgi:hypothetical protein